ncbi:MAG TPA: 50S ribosomal protein L11 methyltransferase [Polyangia bacterium]|nr:50S ribosomal protein L11 methyltransferase [Polyangia bacterium]
MSRYVEIAFAVTPERVENDIETLVALGASGVEERDQTTYDKAPDAGSPLLLVWLPVEDAKDFLVRAEAAGLPPPSDSGRVRHEDEWRDVWKKFFAPRKVGRFVIVPSWEKYQAAPGEVLIDMDPGRAFGTGGHPSTRLCLEAISKLDDCNRFLDLGCGSGVLSIACAKLFPESSGIGVDIDPDSVEVARENVARNLVTERISCSTTPMADVHGPFDLVLANILPDVLIPMAEIIAGKVAPGGSLMLSGILIELADGVEAEYQPLGLRTVEYIDEEGWRAIVMERPA